MPAPGEYKTVQARILAYAQEIGWTFVPRAEAERRRGFVQDGATPEEGSARREDAGGAEGRGDLIPSQGILINAIVVPEPAVSSEIVNAASNDAIQQARHMFASRTYIEKMSKKSEFLNIFLGGFGALFWRDSEHRAR